MKVSYELIAPLVLDELCIADYFLAQASLLQLLSKVGLCTDLQENRIDPFNMK